MRCAIKPMCPTPPRHFTRPSLTWQWAFFNYCNCGAIWLGLAPVTSLRRAVSFPYVHAPVAMGTLLIQVTVAHRLLEGFDGVRHRLTIPLIVEHRGHRRRLPLCISAVHGQQLPRAPTRKPHLPARLRPRDGGRRYHQLDVATAIAPIQRHTRAALHAYPRRRCLHL